MRIPCREKNAPKIPVPVRLVSQRMGPVPAHFGPTPRGHFGFRHCLRRSDRPNEPTLTSILRRGGPKRAVPPVYARKATQNNAWNSGGDLPIVGMPGLLKLAEWCRLRRETVKYMPSRGRATVDGAYDKWWDGVQPGLVNEDAVGPKVNPFKELLREAVRRGAGKEGWKSIRHRQPERCSRSSRDNGESGDLDLFSAPFNLMLVIFR